MARSGKRPGHLPQDEGEAMTENVGPNGCAAALNIIGEHFWCELEAPHSGLAHSSRPAQAIWRGVGDAEDHEAAWRKAGAEESGR